MVDRDGGKGRLEKANWKTHVLLPEDFSWEGKYKTDFISHQIKGYGAKVDKERITLDWGWERPLWHQPIALLGLDSFETRRIAIESGYEWLVDSGIGTNFERPRVTWHSLPPTRGLGKQLFSRRTNKNDSAIPLESPLSKSLEDLSNPCGWVNSFIGISAAAPCMGLVAAAYSWVEIVKIWKDKHSPLAGSANLWSPGIKPTARTL